MSAYWSERRDDDGQGPGILELLHELRGFLRWFFLGGTRFDRDASGDQSQW